MFCPKLAIHAITHVTYFYYLLVFLLFVV